MLSPYPNASRQHMKYLLGGVDMSILTKVVTVSTFDEAINEEIRSQEAEGWFLRGNPIPLGDTNVILTFEKEMPQEEEFDSFINSDEW